MPGPHQHPHPLACRFGLLKQLENIAFPIHHREQARLRHLLGYRHAIPISLQPTERLLLFDPTPDTLFARLSLSLRRIHHRPQNPQRQPFRGQDHRRMKLEPPRLSPRLVGPHKPQTFRVRALRKIQVRVVLHHQHQLVTHHPLDRSFPMRTQHRLRVERLPRIVDERVIALGRIAVTPGRLQIRSVRMIAPVFHNAEQTIPQTLVSQLHLAKFLLGPLA